MRSAGADPALWRFASINQHGSDFDAWMDDRLGATERGADLTFAVFERSTGDFVGSSSYLAVALAHKRLEIGWTWYARRCWGTRVNPAAKHAMLSHGFDALALNRIEFKLDATNRRSWEAVERLGARHEGVFRRHMILPDGRLRDSAWFSILKEEWPAVRRGLEDRLAAFAGANDEKRSQSD